MGTKMAKRRKPKKPIGRIHTRRRPAEDAPNRITLPGPAYYALKQATRATDGVLALGAIARRRAGALLLGVLVIGGLYSQLIIAAIADPRVRAQCDDQRYMAAVISRGCMDPEHCTPHERGYTAALQLASAYAGEHCEPPAPWTPHAAVYNFAMSFKREERPPVPVLTPTPCTEENSTELDHCANEESV